MLKLFSGLSILFFFLAVSAQDIYQDNVRNLGAPQDLIVLAQKLDTAISYALNVKPLQTCAAVGALPSDILYVESSLLQDGYFLSHNRQALQMAGVYARGALGFCGVHPMPWQNFEGDYQLLIERLNLLGTAIIETAK